MSDTRLRSETGPRRQRAATLMEVITCAGAIAVLSTVLLPALGEARRQGKAVHCLANLGRIADASLVYATADASEFGIPAHPLIGTVTGARGEYEWGGKSGAGEPLAGADRLSSKWGTAEGRGPVSRPLNRILYGGVFPDHQFNPGAFGVNWRDDTQLDLDVYRCPADYGYSGHHYLAWRNSRLTSYDHYGNSYTASTSWVRCSGGGCLLESNSAFLKPVSRVPNPAMTVLAMENCGRFGYRANYGGPNDSGCGSASIRTGAGIETDIRGWHGQMWVFHAAFVDGHARAVRMQGHQQPEPQLGVYPSGAPCCCFRVDAGCHTCWHCVIFRGPGWQIDTLPAPPVPTVFPCSVWPSLGNPIG